MRILITALVASMAACGGPSAPGASPHRDGEFDRGASQKALGAVDITACRGLAGPSGRGHVKVTFAADGSVIDAKLDRRDLIETPIDFSGTARGDCVLEKFNAVKVPPFTKGPISVGKAITLE